MKNLGIVLIMLLLVCCLGTSCEKRKPGLPEITDCMIDRDFSNKKSLLENTDITFIGLVEEEASELPNDRYSVKVIETIKGGFSAGESYELVDEYEKEKKR